ncbi:MAG TPA: hypothetical protein VFW33_09370 [Gemmataceae bacterium]|nr:hypothetical protein [Gemmataceae bacterium]
MAFRDFGFPEVQAALGLNLKESDLFRGVPALELAAAFSERMRGDVALALAINTEKARSEFIIAPVLSELRRMLGGSFGLFSGVEFDVDSSRGLNGYCDFILTRSPLQSVLTAPVVAITEAKNDNLRTGLGQCIAEMVAAQEFNAKAGAAMAAVFGVVTTGSAWKFLRLSGANLTLDVEEYFIAELSRIMGMLAHILKTAEPVASADRPRE